jgi:TorA maturation chaperone TorD/Fe-S-cluster-containing hydrogenase component 2
MNRHRSVLYQCLAGALAEPLEWLSLPGRDWPLFEAALGLSRESLAARQAVAAMVKIAAEPMPARRERFERVFYGSDKTCIQMYESGALHGKLLAAETRAVADWYRQVGLATDGAEIPDHVSLELAFLAFLCGLDSELGLKLEKAFLQQHAGRWLPALGRTLAAQADPVYAPVGELLAGWIEEVCCQAGVPGFTAVGKIRTPRPTGRLPYMIAENKCTLCGFCVQACPVASLAICEDEHSTSLVLDDELCIGCGKCARACPVFTLAAVERPQAGKTASAKKTLLKISERIACRACGTPMVSRAELEYVARCLDHPAWLAYCSDCRVGVFI